MKYFILITLLLSSFVDLWAQDETSVFRTSGKIYVVVGYYCHHFYIDCGLFNSFG
jgi:hypothetical protein